MSIDPTPQGIQAAGISLSQACLEAREVARQASLRARQADGRMRAESAAGIDAAQPEQAAADRDGDGRLPWDGASDAPSASDCQKAEQELQQPRNLGSDDCGRHLDLHG